jgi:hypothetical protein
MESRRIRQRRGQVVVLVAILVPVVLLLLAVSIDAGRMYICQAELRQAAQAGADAGMGWVAEQMVTMAVGRQTEAAAGPPCVADGPFGDPFAGCTATPYPHQIPYWLTDEDRAALVSPAAQAVVGALAREYAARNGLEEGDPDVVEFVVYYPDVYDPLASDLRIRILARKRMTILLAGILGESFAEVRADVQAGVTQR